MVILGYEDTLQVTVEDIAHHTAAVARTRPSSFVIADLPWMSYHISTSETLMNAAKLIRAGAQAVKLEGGAPVIPQVEALSSAGIPVIGHLGLTPQSVHSLGGYRVQGRGEAGETLMRDAKSLANAGAKAIVLEAIPSELAARITELLDIPTVGIGAGKSTNAQVIVWQDLLGISDQAPPKFVRQYAQLRAPIKSAVESWIADVASGEFPGPENSYQ
jgi:3-methyl-2-oxobutanoate hydroxymethyltransferase